MLRYDVHHVLEPAERAAVVDLVGREQRRSGHRPVSDQAWLELVHGGPTWHAAITCRSGIGAGTNANELLAICLIGRGATWTLEVVVDRDRPAHHALVRGTLAAALDEVAHAGGGDVRWWLFDAGTDADALAASAGLTPGRALLQMLVGLPLAESPDRPRGIETRPFEVGRDERAWLEVNNAAFAWHPEQGSWDLAALELREREDWFDPAGFLLHERDGRLAAFCWTKLHHDEEPVQGEIYVIAVHPDFHGSGLGRSLTVAGLDHIVSRGVTTGMLFVDQDNTSAVALYESLGFHVHRTDRAYTGHVAAAATAAPTSHIDGQEHP
jgi:mycothiol synthase